MYCVKCYKKEWCICKQIFYVYKKKMFNNQCICCYERMRVLKESKRQIKQRTRNQLHQLFQRLQRRITTIIKD